MTHVEPSHVKQCREIYSRLRQLPIPESEWGQWIVDRERQGVKPLRAAQEALERYGTKN